MVRHPRGGRAVKQRMAGLRELRRWLCFEHVLTVRRPDLKSGTIETINGKYPVSLTDVYGGTSDSYHCLSNG